MLLKVAYLQPCYGIYSQSSAALILLNPPTARQPCFEHSIYVKVNCPKMESFKPCLCDALMIQCRFSLWSSTGHSHCSGGTRRYPAVAAHHSNVTHSWQWGWGGRTASKLCLRTGGRLHTSRPPASSRKERRVIATGGSLLRSWGHNMSACPYLQGAVLLPWDLNQGYLWYFLMSGISLKNCLVWSTPLIIILHW